MYLSWSEQEPSNGRSSICANLIILFCVLILNEIYCWRNHIQILTAPIFEWNSIEHSTSEPLGAVFVVAFVSTIESFQRTFRLKRLGRSPFVAEIMTKERTEIGQVHAFFFETAACSRPRSPSKWIVLEMNRFENESLFDSASLPIKFHNNKNREFAICWPMSAERLCFTMMQFFMRCVHFIP